MKKELLMSLNEFYKIQYQIPYKYIIKKREQRLYYFGSKHSYDPENPQFEAIKDFFNDFVKHSIKEKSIVLVEGGERPIAASEKEAIQDGAEMSFVTFLADKANREVTSPEIPDQKRFELLHQQFSKEEIAYYCFILVCWQWNNAEHKEDVRKYSAVFFRT